MEFIMNDKKYYFMYITTHIESGKYYIGRHETYDINDGYLGSGNLLKRAVKKYGKNSFKRDIICFCNSFEKLNEAEIFYINQTDVDSETCYNLALGGKGGSGIYAM